MIKVIEKVTTIEKFGKKIFHSKEKQPCLTNNFIGKTLNQLQKWIYNRFLSS